MSALRRQRNRRDGGGWPAACEQRREGQTPGPTGGAPGRERALGSALGIMAGFSFLAFLKFCFIF